MGDKATMVDALPVQQNTNKKWPTFVGLSLLVLAAQIYLLFDLDRWVNWIAGDASSRLSDRPEIASLVDSSRDTRLRSEGELAWLSAPSQTNLREYDHLMTGESGQAEVQFNDGLGIIIGPQSMIEVSRSDSFARGGPVRIRLLRGTLRKSPRSQQKAFELIVGSAHLRPNATAEFSISVAESGETQFYLSEGAAEVVSPTGVVDLKRGEKVVLASDPTSQLAPQVDTPPFMPLYPDVNEVIESRTSTTEVNFSWRGSPSPAYPDEPLVLEVAKNQHFSEIIKRITIAQSPTPRAEVQAKVSLGPPNGVELYYWRVRGARSGSSSPSRPFRIQNSADAHSVSSRIPSHPTEEELPPPDLDKAEITIKKMPGPSAIPPAKPKKRTSWLSLFISEAWAAEEPPEALEIHLTWKSVKRAVRYRVEISDSQSFKQTIERQDVEAPEFTWRFSHSPSNRRTYYYRIASIRENGRAGSYSAAKKISLPQANEIYGAVDQEQRDQEPQESSAPSPILVTETTKKEPLVFRNARIAAYTGVGTRAQWGSSIVERVSLGSAALRQSLMIDTELGTSTKTRWMIDLQADLWAFRAPPGTNLAFSDPIRAIQGHLRAERRWGNWSLGGMAKLPFRFVKGGPQSLSTEYGFTIGPSASFNFNFDSKLIFLPTSTTASLALPLSGLLYGSPAIAIFESSTAWRFPISGRWSLDASMDLRASLDRWLKSFTSSSLDVSAGVSLHLRWSL